MKKIFFLLTILLSFSCHSGKEKITELVKVKTRILQGKVTDNFLIFKGVPFAEPPVGDLRWKAPQSLKKWKGIKQAYQYAPSPMQAGNPAFGKSEDCLYLNIWSPAKYTKDKLPIMVWIYGGGFSFGSTSDPVHNGEHLARKGVVVVSIAYRVGQLGFLAHPELSAENSNGVSGNYGLLDQIAGLKCVQQNISAFGGDPDNVTIFGESAGVISVSMLCASPLTKGLFRRAISQSGGSYGPPRPTSYPGKNMKTLCQAEKEGESYLVKASVKTIAELRKIDADKLPTGWGLPGAWPIIDGYVIPDDQYKLYENGNYNDVDVLIGYNSDEGLSFPIDRTPDEFIDNIKKRFGPFADSLSQVYPVGKNSINRSARNLMRDAAFVWHTWSWARLQSKTGKSKVFFYYFDQHPEYPSDSPQADHGIPHGVDVPYVFMTFNSTRSNPTKSNFETSNIMATCWTNFAKYGNPNYKGLPEWPQFNDTSQLVMYLKIVHLILVRCLI